VAFYTPRVSLARRVVPLVGAGIWRRESVLERRAFRVSFKTATETQRHRE